MSHSGTVPLFRYFALSGKPLHRTANSVPESGVATSVIQFECCGGIRWHIGYQD